VIGSKINSEGRIFIESQGWAVLGGAGTGNGRARQAMESVHKHLFTKNGAVLQQPAYSSYDKNLGEVTSYPPGVKENAGIFSHNNTWIHLGWCLLGEGERALEYYHSICPSAKETQIDTYRSEPYVYAQMTAGKDAPCFGEAKNSWLTGTAAWTFVVVSQGIFGIKPDFGGLRIDPCIPKAWQGFEVTRKFRGDTFRIRVNNPHGVSKGVMVLTLDGKTVSGNVVPVSGDGKTHNVEVTLG
jgi:cellobiose phosphorylase